MLSIRRVVRIFFEQNLVYFHDSPPKIGIVCTSRKLITRGLCSSPSIAPWAVIDLVSIGWDCEQGEIVVLWISSIFSQLLIMSSI